MRRPWTGWPAVGRPRARGARQPGACRNRRRQGGRRRLQRAAAAQVQGRLTALSGSLSGKVLVMSGGSRGIGLAIALRAARDGAKVAIIAKTEQPHPKLEGTIYTAAEEIRAAGGEALPIAGDVRDEERVRAAVEQVVDHFGGIDICVNNASAIDLSSVESIAMKRYDLMQDINTRGTFVLTRACLPHLKRAANPHVLTLSPPLNLNPLWFGRKPGLQHRQILDEHVHARLRRGVQ